MMWWWWRRKRFCFQFGSINFGWCDRMGCLELAGSGCWSDRTKMERKTLCPGKVTAKCTECQNKSKKTQPKSHWEGGVTHHSLHSELMVQGLEIHWNELGELEWSPVWTVKQGKTFYHISTGCLTSRSGLRSAVYKSSFYTKRFLLSYRACTSFPAPVFNPDLYSSHRLLKGELCQGQSNYVFLALENLLFISFLTCRNYNAWCHLVC